MATRPTLVVFLGGLGSGLAERMVAGARLAASTDSIKEALTGQAYAGAIVATDNPYLDMGLPGVVVDSDHGTYHFGQRLARLIRERQLDSVVYMGGGSATLLRHDDFADIARRRNGGVAVTNNLFSSDLVAFPAHPQTLAVLETVERDNALARALAEAAQLAVEELPRSLATQMDIDSPTDLAVLKLADLGGGYLGPYLGTLDLDLDRYERVLPLFLDRKSQIVVAGRVSSFAWQYLERQTACRVRLFAEERGLEADGRVDDGTARSLLGFLLESVGIESFFSKLAELGDAAFIDTRVLLAHMGIAAGREDRFLSDLGCWKDIDQPFLREFTQAACTAPIPVILGGHSLMSGGLMALNEFAWQQSEAGSK